jgi:alpha-beta hydrolase superfamily lysophospholipase
VVTARTARESTFSTHDGVELFYRHWPAVRPSRGGILLFHRGHEHSGRMAHLVDELDLPDLDFYAWDARGHGRSPGPRGYSPGVDAAVRDVQSFVDHLAAAHGVDARRLAVVAQSVGAVVAATWVHDYAPPILGMVLASPALRIRLYVPFARPGLALLRRLRGSFFVSSYVKARLLTHDPERVASYEADPLIARPISVDMLLGLHETAARLVADARAITTPTQLLISGADWVVEEAPQHELFVALGATVKERHVLPGFFHDTLGERDRAVPIGHARRFLVERFAATAPERPSLVDADRAGHTRDEAERLATPLPPLSPRGLYWRAQRLSLRLGGVLSRGIALGHETGFDSGSTLDYVYENRARGRGWLGRLADRSYLDAIGWRGIRQRKLHLEELIRLAVRRLREEARPVRLLDVAAGHGRYVLEALGGHLEPPDQILLRDYSTRNVEAGRRLIAERGLGAVARFEVGDAFDRQGLAALEPGATVGVVSGLYELFPDNGMVRESLAGLAAAIGQGGFLIYTGQPWHPQIELIARALTSHRDGRPWVMRRRTQAELDELVARAGFRKIDQRIDRWGIFTVSLARRESAPPGGEAGLQ